MTSPLTLRNFPRALALMLALAGSPPLLAQGPGGPVAVGVTAARSMPVAPTVSLSGSVRSRTSTVVASEIAGLVTKLAVREGESVRRGAAIVHLRTDNLQHQLDAARAQQREATARLELAGFSRGRAKELFDSGVISRQELDNAVSESDAWQGRVDQATAEVARLEDDLARSVVHAPFSGIVVAEHCQIGAWLAVGAPVVEMIDAGDLEVVVDVPERYFASTRRGAQARVRFASLPGLEIQGIITAVIPRADAQARSFPTMVRIANPEQRIGIGMLAEVLLPAGEPRPAVVVPKDAIVDQGGQRLVFVIAEGDGGAVAKAQPVTLGGAAGGWVAVSGIAAGTQVVTRGNERLMPDSQVTTETIDYPAPTS